MIIDRGRRGRRKGKEREREKERGLQRDRLQVHLRRAAQSSETSPLFLHIVSNFFRRCTTDDDSDLPEPA